MGWMDRVSEFYLRVQREQPPDPPPEPAIPLPPNPSNLPQFQIASPFPFDPSPFFVASLFSPRVLEFIQAHRSPTVEAPAPPTAMETPMPSVPLRSLIGIQVAYAFLLEDLQPDTITLEAVAGIQELSSEEVIGIHELFSAGQLGDALHRIQDHRLNLLVANGNNRQDPEVLRLEYLMDHALEDLRALQAFQESPPQNAEELQEYLAWAEAAAPRFDAIYGNLSPALPPSGSNLEDLSTESIYLGVYRNIYLEIHPITGAPPNPENLPATREGLYQLLSLTPRSDGVSYLAGAGRRRLAQILFAEKRFPHAQEWEEILGDGPLEFGDGLPGAVRLLHSLSRRHLGELATWNDREHERAWQEALEQGHDQASLETLGSFFTAADSVITHQIEAISGHEFSTDPQTALQELGVLLEEMTSVRMRTRYAREHLTFLHLRPARWVAMDGGETWRRMRELRENLPLNFEALLRDYQNTPATDFLRNGDYLSRSLQLSLAQQFTREMDGLNATIAGLDQVLGPNFLDDFILGRDVELMGLDLARTEDRALVEDLFALRIRYLHLMDEIQGLTADPETAEVWRRSEALLTAWGELSQNSLWGELSYQLGRCRELVADRATIESSFIDAAASLAGAGLASFLTRLPSVVRIATGVQGVIRNSRWFMNMRPFFQQSVLTSLRIYSSAFPEAFFQGSVDASLRSLLTEGPSNFGDTMAQSMGFVFFQRRLRPLFSRLTRPFAQLERRFAQWGDAESLGRRFLASLGAQGSQLGFNLTQLAGETGIFSLYRIREAGLRWLASQWNPDLEPDWGEVFSGGRFLQDGLQVLQEFVTERPAEALGGAFAGFIGQGHLSRLQAEVENHREFIQSETFADYPPPLARQWLRLFREDLEALEAIYRSQGESFENPRPLETGPAELWQTIQALQSEITELQTREQGLETESRIWLDTYRVSNPATPPLSTMGLPFALSAAAWMPVFPLHGDGTVMSLGLMLGAASLAMAWLRRTRPPSTFTELLIQSGKGGLPPRDPQLNYNAHYQKDAETLPPIDRAHPEGPNRYLDLAHREFPVLSETRQDNRVYFTGREFGRGSNKTAYEAFLIGPNDEYQRVAVLVSDHASQNTGYIGAASLDQRASHLAGLEFLSRLGVGNLNLFGTVELPSGNLGYITNLAPGLNISESSTHSQIGTWINLETLRQLRSIAVAYHESGRGFSGDIQFQIDPEGRVYFIDFESFLGSETPVERWQRTRTLLAEAWQAAGRPMGEFDRLVTRAESESPLPDDLLCPGREIFLEQGAIADQILREWGISFSSHEDRTDFENAVQLRLMERFPFLANDSYLWTREEWDAWMESLRPYLRHLYESQLPVAP